MSNSDIEEVNQDVVAELHDTALPENNVDTSQVEALVTTDSEVPEAARAAEAAKAQDEESNAVALEASPVREEEEEGTKIDQVNYEEKAVEDEGKEGEKAEKAVEETEKIEEKIGETAEEPQEGMAEEPRKEAAEGSPVTESETNATAFLDTKKAADSLTSQKPPLSSKSPVAAGSANKTDKKSPSPTKHSKSGNNSNRIRSALPYSSPIAAASPAPSAEMIPVTSSSRKLSGRQVILDATREVNNMASMGLSTQLHVNAEQLTIPEEYARFRHRNRVAPSYRGPVYVAEDLHVPCHKCGGPLDPVTRVPAGGLFFHPGCIHCDLCGRGDVAEPFSLAEKSGGVLCSECAVRGYHRCVRTEAKAREALSRANSGNNINNSRRTVAAAMTETLNQPVLPGLTAPSLSISRVHTRRNTVLRSFALMQRQQYYTQNDLNILTKAPPPSTESEMAAAYAAAAASKDRQRVESYTSDLPRLA